MIHSLSELSHRLDLLYGDITQWCDVCTDKDCGGTVWLLPEEAEKLYEMGVPIAEINDGIFFIHSFPQAGKRIIVDQPNFPCILRKSKRCSIYSERPLVCRLYPVGFAIEQGNTFLVLYEGCLFLRELREDLPIFIEKVKRLFRDLDKELLYLLTRTYSAAESISKYPSGSLRYIKLLELRDFI